MRLRWWTVVLLVVASVVCALLCLWTGQDFWAVGTLIGVPSFSMALMYAVFVELEVL